MNHIRGLINQFPRLKRAVRKLRNLVDANRSASTDFVRIHDGEFSAISSSLRHAWQSDEIPAKQRRVVDQELARFRAGNPVKVFDIMVESLRGLPLSAESFTLLDIGCASGFYAEVLATSGFDVAYTGCDYSAALIGSAREIYPDLRFDVEDATALRYETRAFDVVVSGCCLLHIPEYEQAIKETARVASKYAIFHRTPVVSDGGQTRFFKKLAYGVETIEIHFNESEFIDLLRKAGLAVIAEHTLHVEHAEGIAVRTFVCEKTAAA